MSTLRITNIEAKADPSSPTVDEKIKLTNSNGDILVHIDGKTSGITTIGINTTAGNIKFDQNSNVVVTGIITATKFVGIIEPTTLTVGGDLTIPDKIVHTGDTNTAIRFPAADTITAETAGTERLRIDSTGDVRFAGTNLTNNTNKNVNLTAPSYNTSEEDVNLVQVENESGMNQISFGGGTSGLNAATSLRFLTASAVNTTTGTERLLITSDGKVGINQSTPQTTFHSTGTTNGQQATFGINNSGLKISTFQKTDNDAGVILDAQKSSNGTLTFATAGTERLRITSTGRIGINETSPIGNLHIGNLATGAGNVNVVTLDRDDGTLIYGIDYSGTTNTTSFTGNNKNFVFANKSGSAEAVRIHSSGVAQFTTTGTQYPSATVPAFVVNSNGDHALVLNNQNTTDPRGLFIYQNQDVNNGTSYFWRARAGGTDRAHLYSNGTLQLHSGNLKLASGNGIDFSATANSYGSMGSEVLDDYEEGTWTPVINKSGVGGTAGTPSTGVGYYRKVGKLLWIAFYWYKSSGGFGNNAGEWYVSGLPYLLAHGTGGAYQFIPGGYNNINGTNYQTQSNRWQSNNTNGSATLAMYGPNATTNWTSGYAEFSASGCLMVP